MGVVFLGSPAFVQQDVEIDSSNSSNANIASPGSFTGAWKSTLGVNAIQVTFISTQNCSVFIEQNEDASANVDVTDRIEFNVLKGGIGTTVQAVSAYYRVRVVNNGAAIATGVRLYAFLCPVADPMPRALDAYGNQKVALFGYTDHFGNQGRITAIGDLATMQPYRLIGTTFGSVADGLDANFWAATKSDASGVAAIVTNGLVTLTSPTIAGYAQLTTVRKARFIHGHPHRNLTRARLNGLSVAGTTRQWGAYNVGVAPTPQDGFVWSVNAANLLTLSCYNGGAVVATASSGSFNGQVSAVTLDQNIHAYDIFHTLGTVNFVLDGVLIHIFAPTTQELSGSWLLGATAASIGTGTPGTLEIWADSTLRSGREESAPKWANLHGVVAGAVYKKGAGRLRQVVVNAWLSGSSISIYDALSATNPIAIITPTTSGGTHQETPVALPYNLDFYTGLYIAQAGAATDATIVYE